uniref:Uncharacterized protein n=1 Tax=Graphocephala atropunctata TaxID=36148 RepID=A0A1B6KER5_9HEMI
MENNKTTIVCSSTGILVSGTTSSERPEKSVTIVEPLDVQLKQGWKSFVEKKYRIEALINEQIEKRTLEFQNMDQEDGSHRVWKTIAMWFLYILLFWLLLTMAKASVCHRYSRRCDLYWHETVLAGVVGCFVTTWHEPTPL